MQNSLISVIVPVYNAEDFLEECIRSIMAQTHSNLEIILVNDGAADNSGVICDALAESDSRVKVIHKVNGGASSARNAGLDNVRGEFVAFVDSDDKIIDVDMYERLHRRIIEADADICVCGYKQFYDGYERFVRVPHEKKLTPTELWESFLEDYRRFSAVYSSPVNKLFRTGLINPRSDSVSAIRFNEAQSTHNDSWFTADCSVVANKGIVFIDITPYAYMIADNPSSISKAETYDNAVKVMKHIEDIMLLFLPQRSIEVKKTMQCQTCIAFTIIYHRLLINKLTPHNKLKWETVSTILRYSTNRSEKCSAILMYFLPSSLYRLMFRFYCKFA